MYDEDDIPSELVFEFPLETFSKQMPDDYEDIVLLFTEWLLLYSFWYYVVGVSKVSDREFDDLKALAIAMRKECEDACIDELRIPPYSGHPNGLGCDTFVGWNESRYPALMVNSFCGTEKNPRYPWVHNEGVFVGNDTIIVPKKIAAPRQCSLDALFGSNEETTNE